MPALRLELTISLISEVPIPAEDVPAILSLARSEAHVMLERGAISIKRPNIETPNESRLYLEFAKPEAPGLVTA